MRDDSSKRLSALGSRLSALALSALALAAIACERTDEVSSGPASVRPSTGRVPGFVIGQIVSERGAEASDPIDEIDEIAIAHRFRAALIALPMFEDEGGAGPVIDFHVEHGLGVGSADPPPPGEGAGTGWSESYVVLMLRAEGGAERDPRYQFEVQGIYRERVALHETPLEAADRLVDAGISDVIEGIAAEARPRVADDAGVLTLLETTEGTALLSAIREVHRRRLADAAPRLRELLGSDDLEVVIAAGTALGRIRDAEAVGPLIDLISRERRELTEIVLPILGQIGSREARAYLETVADAHERPSVRDLARDVLEGMQRPR